MLIIAGSLRINPSEREAYLNQVADVAVMARAASGCLDFVQSADPIEKDRINIFELWEDEAALEKFRALPSDGAEPPPLLGADVRRYLIASVEAP